MYSTPLLHSQHPRHRARCNRFSTTAVLAVLFALPRLALAEDAAKPDAPATPASWQSSIKLGAQAEIGIVGNPAGPSDGQNFGQLFTDHANQVQLNQLLLTAQRAIDPKETGFDVGFKLQGLYGSDARYTHFLGELDRLTSNRYQFDIVEANVTVHLPWLTEGGIDVKAGQYATPIGYETIDPSTNPFYSHSYIFNFGIPLKHTGVLTTTHVNSLLDVYLGIDSGVNTSLGSGDNNGAPAGLFGIGLNLLDGNLTILALSHIGPENPSRVFPNADSYQRYLNDVTATYKASDKLSFTTEVNYIRDDFARAEGYGAAQYVQYALADTVTLNGRAEIWRDNNGFFVGAFPQNLGFVKAEAGYPATVIIAAPTTYSEFTVGVTYKPGLAAPFDTLLLRPELRYDRALNGTSPFNAGRDRGAFTIAMDAVLGF
jgi:hypothetical protein